MSLLPYLACALIGYLLGGIPTGSIVAGLHRVDLTTVGSRKTGATNVLRTLGPAAAAAVFLGDFLKAVVAASLALWLVGDAWAVSIAAVAAMLGHGFSPYIGFRGGRGVTPGLGGLVVISWWVFLVALLAGAVVIALTRFVSLGSMLGTIVSSVALITLVLLAGCRPRNVLFALVSVVFILVSHHDNIQRLLQGRERKLGETVTPS